MRTPGGVVSQSVKVGGGKAAGQSFADWLAAQQGTSGVTPEGGEGESADFFEQVWALWMCFLFCYMPLTLDNRPHFYHHYCYFA